MPVHRLNHAVLYVRDVAASVAFYQDVLGFRTVNRFSGAAFLQAPGSTNDHDLGLFEVGAQAGPSAAGHSTTKALYAKDPDGIEFEVCWLVPADRIDAAVKDGAAGTRRLDLAKEIERYGADTRGGVGVSLPA